MNDEFSFTEEEILSIALRLWGWLLNNPECHKDEYPDFYLEKIAYMDGQCPLCHFYKCRSCPLEFCSAKSGGLYNKWEEAVNNQDFYKSQKFATEIYLKILGKYKKNL